MKTEQYQNLTVNGFGTSSGGKYEKIHLNGKAVVNGSVEYEKFTCNGSATINGNMKGVKTDINGLCKISGNIFSEKFITDGSSSIEGDLIVEKGSINGKLSIDGNLKGEEIEINGKAVINGDCAAESFQSNGQFKIEGLLNADTIDIRLSLQSEVQEIGGQSIKVKRSKSLFQSLIPASLVTDLIEGDYVEIENTKAKTVRGNNVKIGQNCEIGLVEYLQSFDQDPEAVVKESRKTGNI
ncbi:polymer-forming cytoskeletal protein [Bacillaceae bacterium Marseille-Q3522]|nr:polymer-forming cytoskeletal protein [Bacillaceae bacterium Marseille-Q3522]